MTNRDVIDRMNNDQFSEFIMTLIFMSAGVNDPKEEVQELFQKSKDELMEWLEADDVAIKETVDYLNWIKGRLFDK